MHFLSTLKVEEVGDFMEMNLQSVERDIYRSPYFRSEFDTAIFSDPLRFYFNQSNEPDALLLYFRMQKYLKARLKCQENFSHHLFVLLYSESASFRKSFGEDVKVGVQRLNNDFVMGLCGPLAEDWFPSIIECVDEIVENVK